MIEHQLEIMTTSIFTEEQRMIHALLLEANLLTDLGLFYGKMGAAIFFYECGKQTNNSIFIEFADELLDELWCEVDQNTLTDFATGLAGIGWGIEYLIQQGFVEASDDICAEIDRRIMQVDIRRIVDLSLESGLIGILHYILMHIKGAVQRNALIPFDPIYLAEVYTVVKRIKDQTEDTELKDLSENYIRYYETKRKPDYNQDFANFPINEKQKIGLKIIASSSLWRVTGEDIKKTAFGNGLFIFNDKSIASNYGIGTYLREYLFCLEQMDISVGLLELYSTQEAYSIQKDCIMRFYFPDSPRGVNEKYYQNVVRLLRLSIDNTQRYIFHLNFEYIESFVDDLKLYFPNSKIIATVHYANWLCMLNGDDKEYSRIIQNPTCTDSPEYTNLIKDYTFSKKFYDKVDHLIVLCEDTFLALHEIYKVSQEKMTLIPNGIQYTKGRTIPEKQQVREKYSVSQDEKVILFVGRLQESKGVLVLLKAFALVLEKYKNCRLVLVGVGLDCDLKQAIEQCHYIGTKVTFMGEISQQILFDWYQIADIGVIPSYFEQFGYVGIEMMMHRVPIVASNAYGVRNMFKEGENALIAKIGDNENEFIQNLTSRMLEFLLDDEKRERIAQNARKVFEEKYVIEKMKNAYSELLCSLFKSETYLSGIVPVCDGGQSYCIAIVYLAIGKYDILWDEFYHSCEQNLFPEAKKHYFVFTDSDRLLNMELTNVSMTFRKDAGWAVNASAKYDCMLSICTQLEAFDYLFYMNANYQAVSSVWCDEILPTEKNDFLSVLSFDSFANRHPDTYTYDRNPLCKAYIPYGEGKRYYQASFYGGRVPEMLNLATYCAKQTRIDLSKGIMAIWCDESYLNKYLMERNPKIVGTIYCKPEEFEGPCKAILRHKNKIFGKDNIDRLKEVFINPSMSYLRDEQLQIRPLHLVKRFGQLGNQMFQYAFLLGLKFSCPERDICLLAPTELSDKSIRTNDLEQVFDIPVNHLGDDKLVQQVNRTSDSCIRLFREHADSVWQTVKTDWPLLSIYHGYWQTELYFKKIAPIVRSAFRFDTTRLNEKSYDILLKIRSCMAVSIHIRRGDYLTATNQEIYGNICTPDYYRRAIALLKERLSGDTCCFFLFSNDPTWVKENMPMENAIVVYWNQGVDSWQDMYLMSECRHHILANSSFSWWGAWLNARADKIVIAPYRWYNSMPAPDILPEDWIALSPSGSCKNNSEDSEENMNENVLKDQLKIIYRYKSTDHEVPDEFSLEDLNMGRVIGLYTYARYTGNSWFANQADELLDAVINITTTRTNDKYAICRLGCCFIYLLRNGFVEGDEDEILFEIDSMLTSLAMNRPDESDRLLYGWIHYLTLRINRQETEEGEFVDNLNKKSLICLLNCLGPHSPCIGRLLGDIRKLHVLGLFPELTKSILENNILEKGTSFRLSRIPNVDVTFVIPVRIDSSERSANLDMVLEQLANRQQSSILILEADISPLYKLKRNYSNVKYRFVEDHDPVFYRTKYLNQLLRDTETVLVGVWDTDVLLPDEQIDRALTDIYAGKAVMSYPYDGHFYSCTPEESILYRRGSSINYLVMEKMIDNPDCISNSFGGAFLVRKDIYMEAGGENESFYGWGMEDQERVRRMFILGWPVTRAQGVLFHLFHPRNENSIFRDRRAENQSRKEFLKVCSMSRADLRQYIRSWGGH